MKTSLIAKKYGWLALMLLPVLFFSACKDKHILTSDELDDIVQVGYYVAGPATAVASEDADNFIMGLMGTGINEKEKERRPGLYEKYMVLEAGQDFEIIYYDDQIIRYASPLVFDKPFIAYDGNGIQDSVYQGRLYANPGYKMRVTKSGLYHIAIDMNQMGDLDYPCIVVSPVEWQIPQMDWKYLQRQYVSKTSASWLLRGQEVKDDNKDYKFAWGNGWKVALDVSSQACLESNLGVGMKSGAADIPIGKGRWNIILTWNLAAGALEKSFSYAQVPFEGEYITDYSNTVLELFSIESALIDKRADSIGLDEDGTTKLKAFTIGLPTKTGENEYRWYCDSVALDIFDSISVRTFHGKASGESDAFTVKEKVTKKGIYSVEYIRNSVDASKNKLTVTYKSDVPRTPEDYTNFANCELELIGYAIDATQTAGYEVTTRKVGRYTYNRIQIGKPATVSNYVYIWTVSGVNLVSGSGKTVMVATKDGQTYTDANGHSVTQWISAAAVKATPAADGTYNITVTIDAKPEKPTPAISVN